jgi:hypothetical protein
MLINRRSKLSQNRAYVSISPLKVSNFIAGNFTEWVILPAGVGAVCWVDPSKLNRTADAERPPLIHLLAL